MQISHENLILIENLIRNPTYFKILWHLDVIPNNPIQLIQLATAVSCLFVPAYILMLCLSLMILAIYYKFGNRLTENATHQVKAKLRSSMNLGANLTAEEAEREKAERRHKAYGEMAD